MKLLYSIVLGLSIILFFSCQKKNDTSLILYNGHIQTVDPNFSQAEAVYVKNGLIDAIGSTEDIMTKKSSDTKIIDLKGAFVIPGLIEGHGHFSGLGESIQSLNLYDTKSWNQIVDMVSEKVKDKKPGEWILGMGWHQEKWSESPGETYDGYPVHQLLSNVSPENPIILFHASGHGLIANQQAMELANINIETQSPAGGNILRDNQGDAIGVFEENAMDLINHAYEEYRTSLPASELTNLWQESIQLAANQCLSKGLTSFQDAGSSFWEIEQFKKLAESDNLPIRLWAMLRESSEEMKPVIADYKMQDVANNYFTCNAIKTELDGALGSYGAWLLEEYSDKPDFKGQNTTKIAEVEAIAKLALKHDMQLCVHAIGDRANREVLNIVDKLGGKKLNERRWRIEHAQHVSPDDIPRFKELGVIASMQAIHCTSDSPFVINRLGEERARTGAYVWRSFLDHGVHVTNGTDAPVEDVDPLKSFYASVTRKRIDYPIAFFPEQSMTRNEALYAYTMGNAYAAFEENVKGSIEIGKFADFTVLDTNILTCSEEEILQTKVLYTIIDGQIRYKYLEL